eukprot:4607639-Pleurochrysis_carterae.AAC.1
MPPSFYIPILVVYACALLRSSLLTVTTIQAQVHAAAQLMASSAAVEGGLALESHWITIYFGVSPEDFFVCLIAPATLFVVCVANASYKEQMNKNLHTLLQQREQAHRQEEAATRRAAESELRAREAERIAHEQDVQRRNKCARFLAMLSDLLCMSPL